MDRRLIRWAVVAAVLLVSLPAGARAQWGYSAEAGVVFGTLAGTNPVIVFTPAKYMGEEFSWGIRTHVVPAEYFELGASPTAQFHIPGDGFRITGFLGLGVLYADYKNDNDFSFNFPMGASLGIPVSEQNALQFTFALNIHNLQTGQEKKDKYSYALTVGLGHFP